MPILSKPQIYQRKLGADQSSHSKSSGLQVIVTCSPHNFDLVKSLGADSVFDYRSPTCVSDIRAASVNNIRHIFDCISTPATARVSADCFSPNGGKYSACILSAVFLAPTSALSSRQAIQFLANNSATDPTKFHQSWKTTNSGSSFGHWRRSFWRVGGSNLTHIVCGRAGWKGFLRG